MKIKLKAGSSVEIVNQAGDTIAKINENGTIEGLSVGVKCYTGAEDIAEGSTYPLSTFEGIKVGDIVVDQPSAQVFIVQTVDSNSNTIYLYGIASYNEQISVTLHIQNNVWVVTSYYYEEGVKLYKHELANVTSSVNARIIIYSTSNALISNRSSLMYNTENVLQTYYVANIESSQRTVDTILGFTFDTSANKLYYITASSGSITQNEMNTSDFTDKITTL